MLVCPSAEEAQGWRLSGSGRGLSFPLIVC